MLPDAAAMRLAELARAYDLDGHQRDQLERLTDLLSSDPAAPTTIRDPLDVVERHVADSLSALALEPVRTASNVVDIGAGAGLPGLVLGVALPSARVSLLESQARKCAFIERAASGAEIPAARVVCSRAEEWTEGAGTADLATARALAPQPVVLEWAAPLLAVGGTLVDWRGRRRPDEERAASAAAALLGMQALDVVRATGIAQADDHHLHVFAKVSPTPPRFPRRAGVARRRPLAG